MYNEIIKSLKIKIFADGAKLDDFVSLSSSSIITGFTTNPSLMRKEGINDYEKFSKKVLNIIGKKSISFEIFADDDNEIINQARYISSWGNNVYVKIPVINTKGKFLGEVIKKLSHENIKLNITAVFTEEQIKNILNVINLNNSLIISILTFFLRSSFS